VDNLEKNSDLPDTDGYTIILDVGFKLGLSPNTISRMISRKILKGRAIGDTLYLEDT
jgi:hypothetical protein